MNFEERVYQFISKNKLMAPRDLVLIGVSGGADSMSLLSALASLRHRLGLRLQAAHFNHRLRGAAADADEKFVAAWCRRLNVPLTIGRRQGRALKRLSEDKARQMRFEFFIKTAGELHAQRFALAHTRNDLAETVLMRLLRGSGLYGLRAILPQRSIESVVFVRPLIGIDRRDVEAYLKLKRMPFRTDTTNHQEFYQRNKIRRQLLPLLAHDYNPQIASVLCDLAATAGEDYEFLSIHAQRAWDQGAAHAGNKARMDLKVIGRQHPAVARLLLRRMVEGLTGNPSALGFGHVQALHDLADGKDRGTLELPGGLRAFKTAKFLVLERY
ncbi:MAG: tRNA lysidine(34) synthetase TilS [Candidatus Omnitrophica bacterium]|nr:tRNA lysidine(34) synthetase TilS [Candidatus Omnitrophota bacterium]